MVHERTPTHEAVARQAWRAVALLLSALLGLATAAQLAGCASSEPRSDPVITAAAPTVQAGPLIELLLLRTSADRVKVLIDAAGQARVVIAAKELGQVLEVVVRQDTVVQRRVIRAGPSPATVDAAFDEQGRLHVLIDSEHWVLDNDLWQASDRNPWHGAGIKVKSARFVAGAPHLIWSFQVDGAELGAPSRVDWFGFGGGMAAIVWPWFSHGTRAVVVADRAGAFGPWAVFEPDGKSDTKVVGASADRHGKVHAIYATSRPGLGANPSPLYQYVTVAAATLDVGDTQAAQAAPAPAGRPRMVPVRGGHAWQTGPPNRNDFPQRVSADPQSGAALVGTRWIVRNLVWRRPIDWPYPAFDFKSTSGGADSFHGLWIGHARDPWWGKGSPVRYVYLANDGWSGPVDLGVADEALFFGHIWDAIDIAAAPNGTVYVAWPMDHAIVARRIGPAR